MNDTQEKVEETQNQEENILVDIEENETKQEKWDRGKTLMLESLHKPDDRLRGCAHNQKCYHELMYIREYILEHLNQLRE